MVKNAVCVRFYFSYIRLTVHRNIYFICLKRFNCSLIFNRQRHVTELNKVKANNVPAFIFPSKSFRFFLCSTSNRLFGVHFEQCNQLYPCISLSLSIWFPIESIVCGHLFLILIIIIMKCLYIPFWIFQNNRKN